MNSFIIRTEDIKATDIDKYYVETTQDRQSVDLLKSQHQLLLVGARGVGKTMLLRVAEKEMNYEYTGTKILPVYMSFSKGILVNCDLNKSNFRHWMLSKILSSFRSSLAKKGIITKGNNPFEMLFSDNDEEQTSLDKFIDVLEETWNNNLELEKDDVIEILGVSQKNYKIIDDVDFVKEVVEQFCETYGIAKIVLLFDEACHNFIPDQQREFFSLFRDLRSPYICCKAAVYPGITYYGTVQTFHDVITRKVERDFTDKDYISKMREIVSCQLDEDTYKLFEKSGEELNALIISSGGNPRLLLKSLEIASEGFKRLKKNSVNNTIKEFYRSQIWQEHTKLSRMYEGHKTLIDWGRQFIESRILKDTHQNNINRKPKQTVFFCIHRDSPESVKRAVRILEYSGIIGLHTEGTKVRYEIYDRYQLNPGIVIADEGSSSIVERCTELYSGLSVKVYSDYSRDSSAYKVLLENPASEILDEDMNTVLKTMLKKSIDTLDISYTFREKLRVEGINTLEDVLATKEHGLRSVSYIGRVRSRKFFNLAYNAAIEYISG